MAGSGIRTAVAGLSQFAIGANAGLAVKAPEEPVVAGRHSGIGLGGDELALPSQSCAQVCVVKVETAGSADHAATPEAAFKMALFTATRAS